jgi:hypothetical protein
VSLRPGREGFGQLAAEYGLRQYEAVHGWALWPMEQLDAAEPVPTPAPVSHG